MKRLTRWGLWSVVAAIIAITLYFAGVSSLSLVFGVGAIVLGLLGVLRGGIGKKILSIIGIALGTFVTLIHAGIIPFV